MQRWITLGLLLFASAPALAQELPTLDPDAPTACATRPDGSQVQMQCDDEAKRCLVAPVEVTIDDDRTPNAQVLARGLSWCAPAADGAWERLEADGYTFVDARLSAPFGYKRDERNRLFQTHFNLRDRFFVGVGDAMTTTLDFDESLNHTVRMEVGGTLESFDSYDVRRHRFRFLEGSLLIAPFEVDALLFAYDKGRISNQPDFWITTFIGKPRRFDINLDIGPGFFLGRLWFGDVGGDNELHLDFIGAHLNWEILQSANLEDVVYIRVGGGTGIRKAESNDAAEFYLYPEAAIGGALRIGDKGLWELATEVRARYIAEVDSGDTLRELRASASVERILIAINDQPISLFVEPSAHIIDTGGTNRNALQLMVGGRMSFFVPPPDAPEPTEPETPPSPGVLE